MSTPRRAVPTAPAGGAAARRSSPVRTAQRALTRNLLTEAAARVFEQRGYVDASVDDIVREAGSSRATFYLHFESKAAVLSEVLHRSRRNDELRELLQRGSATFSTSDRTDAGAGLQELEAWFGEYVDFYLRHRALHRVVHQAQVVEPEFARTRLQDVQACVDMWQSFGFSAGVSPGELRFQAIMMFALLDTTMHLWLEDGVDVDRDTAVQGLAQTFHRSVWQRRGD